MKNIIVLYLTIVLGFFMQSSWAATVGIHGVQWLWPDKILAWEKNYSTTVPIVGMIFDTYGETESTYLDYIVAKMGTGRIYHISISPYGFTALEVEEWYYHTAYRRFFADMKRLDIKVVFRTMHEMNGGWYSRASEPDSFKRAWRIVHTMAREEFDLQSDRLLFSLSFNSQDLPSTELRPTQTSYYEYCSQWRVDNIWRCPRMEDYYPGDRFVDMIGVTLYNRGRSRPAGWSIWKSPDYLFDEAGLLTRLKQRNKPIIIDELGSTAVNFQWEWSQTKTTEVFTYERVHKDRRLRQLRTLLNTHPQIRAVVYFNIDATAGATKQVLWQADRSVILSPFTADYRVAIDLIQRSHDSLNNLFRLTPPVIKTTPQRRTRQ